MVSVKNVTMDYRIQKDNAKSLKEFVVRLLRGKLDYISFRALENISIQIKKGEVCGIIGVNGAGKSTLLKIISGVLSPTKGSVSLKGNVAPMLELGAGFDYDLTAKENIFLNAAILGYSKEFISEKYDEIVRFSELEDFIEQPLRTFSSGMIMRLAFSIATLVEPEILIVDEILSVGDEHFSKKSGVRMKKLIEGGATVIMVSHNIVQIEQMCDRVIWLEHGKIKFEGPAKEVCSKYRKSVV